MNPKLIGHQAKMMQKLFKKCRNRFLERTNINPNSIGHQFKMMKKSVLGAMLAQDDTSLEPSWPKMSSRIDFSSIFDPFGGSKMKIDSKTK